MVLRFTLGTWKKIATNQCVGSKGSHFKQFQYNSRSTFVVAMKLVHRSGKIGCAGGHFSYWGCHHGIPTNIIVTGICSL
jgi:hypothetical protein